MPNSREYDVIIYGASGYTGRLVAEYMAIQYPEGSGVRWAMAGRNAEKLAQVRDEVGAPASTPLITANAGDPASIDSMVASAKVICTTVGPYQLYGNSLVASCAKLGTDYVDLCGEPAWMRSMIDAYEITAKESGARIVFSCGFDSIPFDLGVFFLQEKAKKTYGGPLPRVRGRVRAMEGKFSGGTAASLGATMAAVKKNPGMFALLSDHFALTPGFEGPEQPDDSKPYVDDALDMWVAPFIMAAINTRNVHRSNFLLKHAYGTDFQYDEMMITGPGEQGKQIAEMVSKANPLAGPDAPKPGEGPTKEERDSGHYNILFIGEGPNGRTIKVGVTGDKDPGYGSTSKMIAESAVCLITEAAKTPGGIYTTAPAMGMHLIKRLRANAGMTFEVE